MFPKPKFIARFIQFAALGLLISCASVEPVADSQVNVPVPDIELTAEEALVLGDISGNPTQKIAQYEPLADYLTSRLTEVGVKEVSIKIAPDLETMQDWIASGDVDLYFDSPYPVMVISSTTEAEPLLRRWKDGVAEYSSIVFTLNTSGIQTLEDLDGKRIALESDFSTSGYMLPLIYLQDVGLNLVEYTSEDEDLQSNEVGFIFSTDEDNTVELVISGEVDAGAIDSETFARLPDDIRSSMQIVIETELVARHIVLASPEMTSEQVAAIKALLLAMDESPDGQAVLESFENTAQFDEFPVEQSIERLRELYNQTL
ncbi:MAG: phosphate/phosphite/phosphonate ABC transporter substrate-binding protein [Cyanobacteria bacterium P01_E01_bin.6]